MIFFGLMRLQISEAIAAGNLPAMFLIALERSS